MDIKDASLELRKIKKQQLAYQPKLEKAEKNYKSAKKKMAEYEKSAKEIEKRINGELSFLAEKFQMSVDDVKKLLFDENVENDNTIKTEINEPILEEVPDSEDIKEISDETENNGKFNKSLFPDLD